MPTPFDPAPPDPSIPVASDPSIPVASDPSTPLASDPVRPAPCGPTSATRPGPAVARPAAADRPGPGPAQAGCDDCAVRRDAPSAERSALLLAVARRILEAPQADAALTAEVFAMIREHLDASMLISFRLDPPAAPALHACAGLDARERAELQRLGLDAGPCRRAVATRAPAIVDARSIATDPACGLLARLGTTAYACHPLLGRHGEVLGTFAVAGTRRHAFTTGEIEFLQTVCHFVALAWDRQRTEEARCRSEAFATSVVAASVDCIKRVDLDGRVLWMNDAGLRARGFDSAASPVGATWAEAWPDEASRAAARRTVAVAAAGGVGRFVAAWDAPARRRPDDAPDDGPRWWDTLATPIRAADGGFDQVLVVSRDVTEQKRAELALRDADARKDEFLATLAHELRGPLAPLRTGAALSRRAAPGSPQADAAHRMIERQLAHMVRLVDDLLDVSRITRGKVALRPEPIALRSIVDEAVLACRPALELAGHRLDVELPVEPVVLHADRTRLVQVFGNLLSNAIKYTPDGGRLALSARVDAGRVEVRLVDSGVGIPADMLPQVFDLFTQVGRTIDRSQGGLGIGLALARDLARLHGGTLEADSPGPGLGSTFTVRLPLDGGCAPGGADGRR